MEEGRKKRVGKVMLVGVRRKWLRSSGKEEEAGLKVIMVEIGRVRVVVASGKGMAEVMVVRGCGRIGVVDGRDGGLCSI